MIDKNYEMGENERLDDLQCNGYKLLQNTACFCFGMDAVLLSSFTHVEENNILLDMCTGNGVIPILIKGKNPKKRYIILVLKFKKQVIFWQIKMFY